MPIVELEDSGIKIELAENSCLHQLDSIDQPDLVFGCLSGACGTCAIQVLVGVENLSPKNGKEYQLLDMLGLNGANCRLACQCRIYGDVRIKQI